jgi:hypothetical protein
VFSGDVTFICNALLGDYCTRMIFIYLYFIYFRRDDTFSGDVTVILWINFRGCDMFLGDVTLI